MGDEKDKKPPGKTEPAKTAAAGETKASETSAGAVDFAALDAAYEKAENAQESLMDRRALGIRQVLGNLQEADEPSLADELVKTLAVAGLAFASQYVTAAVIGKIFVDAGSRLAGAVQEGLHSGLQDAAGKIGGKLAAVDGQSKVSYFAGQEEGILDLKLKSVDKISEDKLVAKSKVKGAATDKQADELAKQVQGAEQFRTSALAQLETARTVQYRESLAKWMNAMSQSALGNAGGGTGLGKAVDMSPKDHYGKVGAKGVIYVAFASHPASRPFAVSGKRATIRVSGMTSAARDQIKSVPIKDLGMPIVASGFIYDGFLDGLSVAAGDNEAAFGKNEAGHVWWKGHGDAESALKKAANKSSVTDAARVILDEDIGVSTLEHAHMG